MRKLKLYLETSVWNFYYADDAPEKRDITREFFQAFFKDEIYEIYISQTVIEEIGKAEKNKKQLLMDLLGNTNPR